MIPLVLVRGAGVLGDGAGIVDVRLEEDRVVVSVSSSVSTFSESFFFFNLFLNLLSSSSNINALTAAAVQSTTRKVFISL